MKGRVIFSLSFLCFLCLLNFNIYAQQKSPLVEKIENSIINDLNPNNMHPLVWVEVISAYHFKFNVQLSNVVHIIQETPKVVSTKVSIQGGDQEFIGYLLEFRDKWGGRESSEVKFRNGKVGSCKAIPFFAADGTEAKVNGNIFVYREKKWILKE